MPKKQRMIDKPYNGGQWTAARYRSFVMSALRGARWPQKYGCINAAFVRWDVVGKRRVKLHRCTSCGKLYPRNQMQADHIQPVVPVTGFDSWDKVIARLYCEADGFQAVCKPCHRTKTLDENKERRANK
jgi:hypothetical protein